MHLRRLLKKEPIRVGLSAVTGGVIGVVGNSVIGGVGLAVGGTAISIGIAPFVITGATLVATGYALVCLGKRIQKGY